MYQVLQGLAFMHKHGKSTRLFLSWTYWVYRYSPLRQQPPSTPLSPPRPPVYSRGHMYTWVYQCTYERTQVEDLYITRSYALTVWITMSFMLRVFVIVWTCCLIPCECNVHDTDIYSWSSNNSGFTIICFGTRYLCTINYVNRAFMYRKK